MSRVSTIRALLKPTFPKAIVCVSLALGFVMVKYRAPLEKPTSRRAKVSPALERKLLEPSPKRDRFVAPLIPLVLAPPSAPVVAEAPAKVKRKIARKTAPKIPHAWVATQFEAVGTSELELDKTYPLADLAKDGFMEESQTSDFSKDRLMAALQFELDTPTEIAPEQRILAQVGIVQKNEFEELRAEFEELSKDVDFVAGIHAPRENRYASADEQPLTVIDRAPISDEPVAPSVAASAPEDTATSTAAEEATEGLAELVRETEAPVVAEAPIAPKPDLSPKRAGIGSDVLQIIEAAKATPIISGPTLVKPMTTQTTETESNKTTTQNKENTQNKERYGSKSDDESYSGGKFYGDLTWDSRVAEWLGAKGHIELRMQKEKSTDPADTIFLHEEYQFPERRFEIDATKLKDSYHLIAAIYKEGKVADVLYPKTLVPKDYKENVRFHITRPMLDKAMGRAYGVSDTSLNATIFEAASGNHRSPKAIPGATLKIAGLPELGAFRSDAQGSVRFPKIPAHSEIIVEVEAPGYYPTRHTIPIFEGSAYAPIYLLEKDKVDVITQYFTKKSQGLDKGIIFGRAYDSDSRTPMKGEQVALSSRKGHALYFDSFPNLNLKQTSETGLFAFLNVEPSLRVVYRPGEKPGMMLDVPAGFAQYVELGRGGKKTIIGRLYDPFANEYLEGRVRLVGDEGKEAKTHGNGKFEVPNVDLPPGVITIEVSVDGYPTTWHTLPWSAREAKRTHSLFMLEKELVRESQKQMAGLSIERGTGIIAGGAHASFFQKDNRCVRVELQDTRGNAVMPKVGPYYFAKPTAKGESFCLTAAKPGFGFYNVSPGEYLLKWRDSKGRLLRAHIVRVGADRVSIVVN